MIVELGDPHNFGKKVTLASDGFIHKPRSLFLEQVFLDPSSSFRKIFDLKVLEVFKNDISTSIFPNLTFSKLVSPLYDGTVTKLILDKEEILSTEVLIKTGILLGTCSYLGIGDLHDQNMAIGRVQGGSQFICSPLDIECIFSLCRLTSQTLLIPSQFATTETCGLKEILKLLPNDKIERHKSLVQIIYSYLKTLELLKNDHTITNALIHSLPDNLPIRVIIRNTQVYYDFLRKNQEFPALESETLQLKRGDIPFFYRRVFSSEVKWLAENSNDIWGKAQDIGDFEFHKDSKGILEPSLLQGDHPCHSDLYHASSLQIIRNLFPSFDEKLTSHYNEFKIETTPSNIKVTNDKGIEWSCKY